MDLSCRRSPRRDSTPRSTSRGRRTPRRIDRCMKTSGRPPQHRAAPPLREGGAAPGVCADSCPLNRHLWRPVTRATTCQTSAEAVPDWGAASGRLLSRGSPAGGGPSYREMGSGMRVSLPESRFARLRWKGNSPVVSHRAAGLTAHPRLPRTAPHDPARPVDGARRPSQAQTPPTRAQRSAPAVVTGARPHAEGGAALRCGGRSVRAPAVRSARTSVAWRRQRRPTRAPRSGTASAWIRMSLRRSRYPHRGASFKLCRRPLSLRAQATRSCRRSRRHASTLRSTSRGRPTRGRRRTGRRSRCGPGSSGRGPARSCSTPARPGGRAGRCSCLRRGPEPQRRGRRVARRGRRRTAARHSLTVADTPESGSVPP